MKISAFSSDIFTAANLHLSVLDEFIAIVQSKLAETVNPFARDSLNDLLANLTEQRDSYLMLADSIALTAHVA
ncbi:hypothetical protein [Azospirillum thermophilum]|uniref:Uncharacterized protein n=1 Tax=Azospirillum thermophilum TaxID=2202148 RepID=A0A2S2D0E7_9PROT|nr:hypothetical protein [Azospirillum thermophilum]AWK90222.1 hypothetical protein DEW08_29865 [Azospirillum thermophilum]